MKTRLSISKLAACVFGTMIATSVHAVWINEFHYDNPGTDAGEFIEVAGLAGTDLSGYQILLYNGAGGAVYETIHLTGVIDDESNGYGALSFFHAPIQNGDPDGFALFDGTTVLQFLSYEGVFLATSGAASGMSSIDVGLSEPGSKIGQSLQLVGLGSVSSDFAWSGPASESPGSLNAGQTFPLRTSSVPETGSSALMLGFALTCCGLVFRCRPAA